MAKAAPIPRETLVGIWQMQIPMEGFEVWFVLNADGSAEQRSCIQGMADSIAGTWEFDGDRKWTVKLPQEEIEHDVVEIGQTDMQCTNWDDDAVIFHFKRMG